MVAALGPASKWDQNASAHAQNLSLNLVKMDSPVIKVSFIIIDKNGTVSDN